MKTNEDFRNLIGRNIRASGFHVTVVSGSSQVPSFAYTIGLLEKIGFEIFIAGCSLLSVTEAHEKLSDAAVRLLENADDPVVSKREANTEWVKSLLLGAVDYFQTEAVRAFQLVSPFVEKSIDQPDTSLVTDLEGPPWIWIKSAWTFAVSETSKVVTDRSLLTGRSALEAVRWESDIWEVFSKPGPDVQKSEIFIVPLSVVLRDASNFPLLNLDVGGALWRASGDEPWVTWRRRT